MYISLSPPSSVSSSGSKEESPLFPAEEGVGSDLAHDPDAQRGLQPPPAGAASSHVRCQFLCTTYPCLICSIYLCLCALVKGKTEMGPRWNGETHDWSNS